MSNDPTPSSQPEKQATEKPAVKLVPFQTFLEEYPLNSPQHVSGYCQIGNYPEKKTPRLRLWCGDEHCQGYRRFDGHWESPRSLGDQDVSYDFLVYTCRDCGKTRKTFCIGSAVSKPPGNGVAVKIGEFPEVHIDLPSFLPTLLGEDYNFFIKGLKSEKHGLGIGAFAYYRRVVENQKGRLFSEIAKVARRLSAPSHMISALEAASKENQFTKALEDVKDLIPPSLMIDGHNPMKLLHKALSVGLHAKDDETCLKIAHSIRMVLQDLSVRIKEALREERDLKQALSDLLQADAQPQG